MSYYENIFLKFYIDQKNSDRHVDIEIKFFDSTFNYNLIKYIRNGFLRGPNIVYDFVIGKKDFDLLNSLKNIETIKIISSRMEQEIVSNIPPDIIIGEMLNKIKPSRKEFDDEYKFKYLDKHFFVRKDNPFLNDTSPIVNLYKFNKDSEKEEVASLTPNSYFDKKIRDDIMKSYIESLFNFLNVGYFSFYSEENTNHNFYYNRDFHTILFEYLRDDFTEEYMYYPPEMMSIMLEEEYIRRTCLTTNYRGHPSYREPFYGLIEKEHLNKNYQIGKSGPMKDWDSVNGITESQVVSNNKNLKKILKKLLPYVFNKKYEGYYVIVKGITAYQMFTDFTKEQRRKKFISIAICGEDISKIEEIFSFIREKDNLFISPLTISEGERGYVVDRKYHKLPYMAILNEPIDLYCNFIVIDVFRNDFNIFFSKRGEYAHLNHLNVFSTLFNECGDYYLEEFMKSSIVAEIIIPGIDFSGVLGKYDTIIDIDENFESSLFDEYNREQILKSDNIIEYMITNNGNISLLDKLTKYEREILGECNYFDLDNNLLKIITTRFHNNLEIIDVLIYSKVATNDLFLFEVKKFNDKMITKTGITSYWFKENRLFYTDKKEDFCLPPKINEPLYILNGKSYDDIVENIEEFYVD